MTRVRAPAPAAALGACFAASAGSHTMLLEGTHRWDTITIPDYIRDSQTFLTQLMFDIYPIVMYEDLRAALLHIL